MELSGKMLTNHLQGCELNIPWEKKKKQSQPYLDPQDEKGLLVFGILLKSLEKQISSHPRKQADLNTYLYNSQNKGTTPSLPGLGMKSHAKSRERKQDSPTKETAIATNSTRKVWAVYREEEVHLLIFIWPHSHVSS